MPSATEGKYAGEFLVSEGNGQISREVVTALSGQTFLAGSVIGQITVGTAVAAATGGNTGNGTSSAVVISQGAVAGVYTAEAISATKFEVQSPTGQFLGTATAGVAFTGGGLTFTLTAGGTAWVVGDSWTFTVAAGSGKYKIVDPAATDGSQISAGFSWAYVDATAGDTPCVAILRHAEYNDAEVDWGTMNGGQITTAKAQLATIRLIARKGY